MVIKPAKTFLFMAFDIAGFSKQREQEHHMREQAITVYRKWAEHRGVRPSSWYELLVGDELIIAADDTLDVAKCFLKFITEWRIAVADATKKRREEIYLRFALHRGEAMEVAIQDVLHLRAEANMDNLLGDSINILSRLLGVARPTQVLASSSFWDRISGFFSRKEITPAEIAITDPSGCRFDLYSVTVKHHVKLDVYNLLWDSVGGRVGHPAPIDSIYSAYFKGNNNYHSDKSFGPILRMNEEMLFDFYGSNLGEKKLAMHALGRNFWRLPYIIEYQHADVNESFNPAIELSGIDFSYRFTDPDIIENFKRQASRYEENSLAAIDGIIWDEHIPRKPKKIALRRVQYSDVVSTDLCPDLTKQQGGVWASLRSRKFSFQGNQLWELGQHPSIPDAIGTTSEVITSDDLLFHPWRSPFVHSHPSTYTAGASGAVDWKDVDDAELKREYLDDYNLKKRYKAHIARPLFPLEWPAFRELNEELGVQPEDIRKVHFLGIARELLRLAKPNFFFVFYLAIKKAELVKDRMPKARESWEIEYWESGEEKKPRELELTHNEIECKKLVFEDAITGNDYNPVTRMALYLLANCEGALRID